MKIQVRMALYYRQFPTNIKIERFWTLEANNFGFNLIIFIFNIRGKLSIIKSGSIILQLFGIYKLRKGMYLNHFMNNLITFTTEHSTIQ